MKNSCSLKSMGLGVVKVVSFIILIQVLIKILLIPLSEISKKYWSHLDGRGLNEPWFISSTILVFVSSLVICYFFVKYFDKKKWDYIRFTFDNSLKYFTSGNIIAGIIIIAFAVVNIVAGNINVSLDLSSTVNILLHFFFGIITLFSAVAYEELVVRGYILRTLEEHFNKITAVLASSLLFSAAHFANPNVSFLGSTNIFLAGVLLALICIYFNNLWFPIGLHFGWNFLLWFFNFPVSGKVYPNPIIKLNYTEYNMVIGNKFGPEESFFVTVILFVAIGYFLFRYKSKDSAEFASNS